MHDAFRSPAAQRSRCRHRPAPALRPYERIGGRVLGGGRAPGGWRTVGPCQVVHFGTGRVAGYSLVQLIETSLVSGHFVEETNRAFIDVFSCAPYDPATVAAFAGEYFRGAVGVVSVTLRR